VEKMAEEKDPFTIRMVAQSVVVVAVKNPMTTSEEIALALAEGVAKVNRESKRYVDAYIPLEEITRGDSTIVLKIMIILK